MAQNHLISHTPFTPRSRQRHVAHMGYVVGMVSVLSLSKCASHKPPSLSATSDYFASSEAQLAKRHAPDLFVAANRARREALHAEIENDMPAAADHATRARILFDAAVAEAERALLERKRLEAEQHARRALESARRDEAAMRNLMAELTRQLAARVAEQQSTEAVAQAAALSDTRRRSTHTADSAQRRAAAKSLLSRAKLILEAAYALGAPGDRLQQIREVVERSGEPTLSAEAGLQAANQAYEAAYGLLGFARRTAPIALDDAASLVEAARVAGFVVEQAAPGLTLRLGKIFAPQQASVLATQRSRLERAVVLLKAHPSGPVLIEVGTAAGAGHPTTGSSMAARTSAITQYFGRQGVPVGRLKTGGSGHGLTDGEVELIFVAYGAQRTPSTPGELSTPTQHP